MSADGLRIATHEFPDPTIYPSGTDQRVNSSISYTYLSYNDIRTLSTNSAKSGSDRLGFLYVPTLDPTDACSNASTPYVPFNVTRLDDVPRGHQMVAMAPWVSPACTLSYLRSASSDDVVAFIFFLPNSTSGTPPTANDAAWGLGDGGQWKKNNSYPVYAISAPSAEQILFQSSLYSGNTSSAPFGPNLTAIYGEKSYVRLYVDIDLGSSSSPIPSIWVFLLIILAVLLSGVGIVSATMHWMQHRKRQALRRRIIDGQVDLEALGIRRLTVPQDIVDKMPLYPYQSSPTATDATIRTSTDLPKQAAMSVSGGNPVPGVLPMYQPTCAICLDDFVPQETLVRELPCRHIFHPACCDAFLKENSTLCPLCKRSTLPKGYCPAVVSNIMVRRERNLRQQHRRDTASRMSTSASTQAPQRYGNAEAHTVPGDRPVEMATMHGDTASSLPLSTPSRSEWARRRALAMLGPRAPPVEDENVRPSVSRPMKFLRSMFPSSG